MLDPDPMRTRLEARLGDHRRTQAQRRELNAALSARQARAAGTWSLLAINVIVFIAMMIESGRVGFFPARLLVAWGALFAPRVADGEWWRLFSAMFVHVGLIHLVFNMIALAMIGPPVERLVGTRAFLAFYLASGLVGSASSLQAHPLTTSAGASGAIIGVYGVLLAMMFDRAPGSPAGTDQGVWAAASNCDEPSERLLATRALASPAEPSADAGTANRPRHFVPRRDLHVHLQPVVWVCASTLLFGWIDPRADNAAHLGGFLAGCVFGWAGGRLIESSRPALRVSAAALAVAFGCAAVSLAVQRKITDVRPALMELFQMDSRALAQYSRLAASHAEPAAIARTIETDILPAFARARAGLDSIGPVARQQDAVLVDMRLYLLRREEFWHQRAAATGEIDDATRRKLEAADRSADAAMRRLLLAR
jgi:membrane associated rhomboid family serine protease